MRSGQSPLGSGTRPSRQGIRRAHGVALLTLALACSDADAPRRPDRDSPAPDSATAPVATVTLHFTRAERPIAVVRALHGARAELRTALELLLAGPSAQEAAAGITSWFSESTAGMLQSVAVDDSGRAVVDFADLDVAIPSASSSAGSSMLLAELNGTVFEFPEVRTVEYRIEGSCDAFWNWLQYDCQVVPRPADDRGRWMP